MCHLRAVSHWLAACLDLQEENERDAAGRGGLQSAARPVRASLSLMNQSARPGTSAEAKSPPGIKFLVEARSYVTQHQNQSIFW